MGKLTAVAVKAALANPGTYQDGDGLFLKVDKRGGASWLLRLQRDGRRQDIGLGSAKLITLAEVRQKASELRKAIKIDRRDVLVERKDEAAAKVTFREAAREYHMANEAGWKSKVYARQWLASLENYAFPKLGNEPTGAIAAADIINVLTPIWQEIPETARQVRNRICTVLDFAHAKGWRSREAPSGHGSLKAGRGLPRQVKSRENRKAMPYVALPGFITALQRKPSYSRLALELLILTGVRSQEVRLATWAEFDLGGRLWIVPAEHMKRGKSHIVPLSDAALELLSKAHALRLPRFRPLGHEAQGNRGDILVAAAIDEPCGHMLPCGRRGSLGQRCLGDRSLAGCHELRFAGRHVGRELIVEARLEDVEVVAARGEFDRRRERGPERAAGELAGQAERRLADVGREGGDIDQALHIRQPLGRFADDRAAVGMADQNNRAIDAFDDVGDDIRVGADPAQRIGRRDHRVAVVLKDSDDAVPARRIGEGAMDEDHSWFAGLGRCGLSLRVSGEQAGGEHKPASENLLHVGLL
jgi:integrase